MGNILRKIIRKKKQEEKDRHESQLYATYSCLPDYMWTDEVRQIFIKRKNEEFRQLQKFINDMKIKYN